TMKPLQRKYNRIIKKDRTHHHCKAAVLNKAHMGIEPVTYGPRSGHSNRYATLISITPFLCGHITKQPQSQGHAASMVIREI
ncbi:hypothetical protein, partial [Salmonella sp. s54395]|uniref:hypothetical protein n=1 Tax=Salmonella sp. s54395 TaxID=3159664 RepID=UPI0039810C03